MSGKNTESVINWFQSIPNKHLYTFLMFDINDFNPLIKEKAAMEGHEICQTVHFCN